MIVFPPRQGSGQAPTGKTLDGIIEAVFSSLYLKSLKYQAQNFSASSTGNFATVQNGSHRDQSVAAEDAVHSINQILPAFSIFIVHLQAIDLRTLTQSLCHNLTDKGWRESRLTELHDGAQFFVMSAPIGMPNSEQRLLTESINATFCSIPQKCIAEMYGEPVQMNSRYTSSENKQRLYFFTRSRIQFIFLRVEVTG